MLYFTNQTRWRICMRSQTFNAESRGKQASVNGDFTLVSLGVMYALGSDVVDRGTAGGSSEGVFTKRC